MKIVAVLLKPINLWFQIFQFLCDSGHIHVCCSSKRSQLIFLIKNFLRGKQWNCLLSEGFLEKNRVLAHANLEILLVWVGQIYVIWILGYSWLPVPFAWEYGLVIKAKDLILFDLFFFEKITSLWFLGWSKRAKPVDIWKTVFAEKVKSHIDYIFELNGSSVFSCLDGETDPLNFQISVFQEVVHVVLESIVT